MGAHSFDDHFLWNKFLISGLLDFRNKLDRRKQIDLDRGGFLVSFIVDTKKSEQASYILFLYAI